MSTQGFIGQEVTMETEGLASLSCAACHDSHSIENQYQLRYEEADELCAQCHVDSHHPQSELYPDSAHDKADVECVQCHGAGERLWHGSTSAWFNHTFGIYNTFYPYNQTEPMVCGNCHELEWATEQLEVIETLTADFMANITEVVEGAEASIASATAAGATEAALTEATELATQADDLIHWVAADASGGLHNPERVYAIMGHAMQLAGEAEASALEAEAAVLEGDVSSLESDKSSLESEVSSLESETASLTSEVAALESEVSSLEADIAEAIADADARVSSSRTTNMGIGAIVGIIIGAAAIFFLKKS